MRRLLPPPGPPRRAALCAMLLGLGGGVGLGCSLSSAGPLLSGPAAPAPVLTLQGFRPGLQAFAEPRPGLPAALPFAAAAMVLAAAFAGAVPLLGRGRAAAAPPTITPPPPMPPPARPAPPRPSAAVVAPPRTPAPDAPSTAAPLFRPVLSAGRREPVAFELRPGPDALDAARLASAMTRFREVAPCGGAASGRPRLLVDLGAWSPLGDPFAAVRTALAAAALPPDRLELVLPLDNEGRARATLQRFRALGIAVSLGGYGSFAFALERWLQLPLDGLTLERGTLHALTGQGGAAASLPRRLVATGRRLGLAITVAGVDTPAQAELAAALGADALRGAVCGPARPLGTPDPAGPPAPAEESWSVPRPGTPASPRYTFKGRFHASA